MGMNMTGTVEINELRLFAHHGVMEQERIVGNEFTVTVHLRYPMHKAIHDDNLDGTLNYAEAVEVICREMSMPSALLEHVAGRIHVALTDRWPLIEGGMIRIAKVTPPIPAQMKDVAVRIDF
ncbi:MAG: dihydroneopterin aldolase [Duncaniella sp.]|nr:dihydroneopterin aldolase [Duncaniella sp.]